MILDAVSGDQLWESVTSVSNAGRKKGRAKTAKRRIPLYKGKKLGYGKPSVLGAFWSRAP